MTLLGLALAFAACGGSTTRDRHSPSKSPVGGSCDTHADCESGICEGMGCDAGEGTCAETDRACTDDFVTYCGCDGNRFFGSGSCPGARYDHRGACQGDAEPGYPCDTDSDCGSGVCEGMGCGANEGTCRGPGDTFTPDNQPFCGCDGETFYGSGSSPGRRYSHTGSCEEYGPAGSPCDNWSQCESGVCEGESCVAEGRCAEADRECTDDRVEYCGCEGETFYASSSCPGQRYDHVGACETLLPAPEGCEFLLESEPAPTCGSGAACDQVQSADEPRLFDLELRERTTDEFGNDVAYSDAELDTRLACLVAWLEDLGLEPNALENLHAVTVDATYEEISVVLGSAVIDTYWLDCAGRDCTYCQDFDEAECDDDAFCAPYAGQPVDEALQCLEASTFMVCVGANDGFAEAGGYQRDASGQCWFTHTQAYNLVAFSFDESCTESEPTDTALPGCE